MLHEQYTIWNEGEYRYPAAFGFIPNLRSYLHEDEEDRPSIVVVPGGGYRVVSPTEGEIVAKKFYEAGFHAFVLTYSTNMAGLSPLKTQPMLDLSRGIRYIRARAKEFHVNPWKLFVCGFSAGAHLAGSLAVHLADIQDPDDRYQKISGLPTGVILSYPVITSGEYAHRDSFLALCGEDAGSDELDYYSLENQVKDWTPPVFLWQTVTDESVPVENSLLMAAALKSAGISFELHLFPKGQHGLSLSNEEWQSGQFGEHYTMEQNANLLRELRQGRISISEEIKKKIIDRLGYLDDPMQPMPVPGTAMKEVAIWPELATAWMRKICEE